MATTPLYNFPHTEVRINDNTAKAQRTPVSIGGTRLISVLRSPRGVDGKIMTISTGVKEFIRRVGMGPFATYGQPLLNAYLAASTDAATLYVLRVMPYDATRANMHIYAAVAVHDAEENANEPWNTEGMKRMEVKFLMRFTPAEDQVVADKAKTVDELIATGEGSLAEQLKPTMEGYEVFHLFSVACTGRGEYGNAIAVRVISDTRGDKSNEFKNYTFQILESNELSASKSVCFYDDAIYNDDNKAADVVVNDVDNGIEDVRIGVNYENIYAIVEKYNDEVAAPLVANEDAMRAYAKYLGVSRSANDGIDIARKYMSLDIRSFDVLLGINKNIAVADNNLAKILNYDISASDYTGDIAVINLNEVAGNHMAGGAEGKYIETEEGGKSLNDVYLAAFSGEIDPDILSKNKYPADMILDAAFPPDIKIAIGMLVKRRNDSEAYLDLGVGMVSKADPLDRLGSIDLATADRLISVDGYQCKMKDPYTHRIIEVTSTALLAMNLCNHFSAYNGKHIPYAGGRYGVMSGFIPGSVFPCYDEAIDSAFMTQMYNSRVNYAQINPKSVVTRATQQTRQEIASNLSELNNMHVVLDIKRDCENLIAQYNYNFLNAKELAAFNKDAQELLRKYDDTQVQAISATFESTDLEEEQGILHLYVDIEQKKIIKTAMIDININK